MTITESTGLRNSSLRQRRLSRHVGDCSCAVSTVDIEAGAGDVGGVRARQERDAGGDLLGTAVATDGDGRAPGGGVFAVGGAHVRVDESGLQDVDRDPAPSEVTGGTAGVAGERRLGGGVVGHPGGPDAGGDGGTDVDDSTAVVHVLDRLADAGDDARVVHGVLAVE